MPERHWTAGACNARCARWRWPAASKKNQPAFVAPLSTHLIEAGVSLQDVQHILGHRSILTTNRYTHLTTQSEALASQRIDALMSRFNLGWGVVK